MIKNDPSLRDSSNGKIICVAFGLLCLLLLVVVVIAMLVAFFLLFAIIIVFLLFNLFLFVLPQPARTVECDWIPKGRATLMNKVEGEKQKHPLYELVERFVYAEDLPPYLKENVSELIGGYKEQKDHNERLINEAIKAKNDWYQAVYRAEGQRLDRLIDEARKKNENWKIAAVAEVPSELVNFGGSIPGEWRFAWKKIRQFFSRILFLGF